MWQTSLLITWIITSYKKFTSRRINGDVVQKHALIRIHNDVLTFVRLPVSIFVPYLRQFLDKDSTILLLHAFVISSLDYNNSLLFGLPDYDINRLQLFQNSAARLVHVSMTSIKAHLKTAQLNLHGTNKCYYYYYYYYYYYIYYYLF